MQKIQPPRDKAKFASATNGEKRRTPLHLTYVIGRLDRILRRRMTDVLAPFGLTLAQFTALSVLAARGQASNAQLAVRSFITPQSANEVVNAMTSKKWITREPDPNHGRIVVLTLTEDGRQILRQCEGALRPLEKQMLTDIEPEDSAAIQNYLEIFVRNLGK